MKKLIWGIVLCLAIPLMGQLKEVTDSEGNVYNIYIPQVIRPVLTLPEVIKLSITEIQALSPDVITATVQKLSPAEISVIQPIKLVYMVSRLTAQELRRIEPTKLLMAIQRPTVQELEVLSPVQLLYIVSQLTPQEIRALTPDKLKTIITRPSSVEIRMLQPETIAIVITQLQERDLDEVLQKIDPWGYWYAEQVKFFDVWKKRDIRAIASIVAKTRVEQPDFFTAWGNYQNFSEINWSRYEPFEYRQVLIQSVSHAKETISYDWREKFKPREKIILTIDFDLNAKEVQALQEMIAENKNKILMVILPWGGQQVNNYDNKNVATYAEVGEWGDRLFYLIKEVAPNIPVGLTVCWVDSTMKQWMAAFKAPYDFYALWNIDNTYKAPLKTIYDRFQQRFSKAQHPNSGKIILSGIFECSPDKHWIPWSEAKQLHLDNYQQAKDAGFMGTILMTNTRD